MDLVNLFGVALIVRMFVEKLAAALRPVIDISGDQLWTLSLLFGVLLAILGGLDGVGVMLGFEGLLAEIVTGVAVSAGSNFLHDLVSSQRSADGN